MPRPQSSTTPADYGYAYEEHTIALPDGGRLAAWSVPHPQPRGIVLLFHGYVGSREELLPPAQVFHDMGYTSLLVAFRGTGDSSGTATTLGVHEAHDVAAAAAYARSTWPQQPLLLYGSSMGGVAVLRAVAREGVQPAAIIAEAPFDRMINAVRAHLRLMDVSTFPTAELLIFWGGVQHGFNAFANNATDYAQEVSVPTLLLRGADDLRVSEAELTNIYAELAGKKQRITVPGVGHKITLTPQHTELQQQVAQFLHEALPPALQPAPSAGAPLPHSVGPRPSCKAAAIPLCRLPRVIMPPRSVPRCTRVWAICG
jgi:hypothetical protein